MKRRSRRNDRKRVGKRRRLQAGALSTELRNTALATGAAYTVGQAAPYIRGAYEAARDAYGYAKRRRSVPAPQPPPRRRVAFARGAGSEMSIIKRRFGRRRPMKANKLSMLSITRTVFRYQGVNRMNAVSSVVVNADGSSALACPGYFRLSLDPNAVGNQRFPLHVYDLTSFPNTNASYVIQWQMIINDTGNVGWNGFSGQGPTGAVTSQWTAENMTLPTATIADIPANGFQTKYVQHDGFDVRMACYGCRQQPTFYEIMIVRFNEDYLVPNFNTGQPVPAGENLAAFNNLWSGLVKGLSFNPILPGTRGVFKGMHVLKRIRFTLQPSMTTEADRNPNVKIVKFKYNDYRIRDYNFGATPFITDADVNAANYVIDPASAGPFRNHPKDKARLFMVVRASNNTPVALASETADNTPSYDIVIRKQCRHREA